MVRWQIELHSDGSLILLGPTGVTDPSTPVGLPGGTCVGRLMDNGRRSAVAVDSALNDIDVTVLDGSLFTAAETVHIPLDDKSHILRTIDSIASNVITLTASIGAGRKALARDWSFIAVQIGADITMSNYGTPATPNGSDWGYRGEIAHTLDLSLSQDIRAEIDFNGGSGLRKYITLPSINIVEGGG